MRNTYLRPGRIACVVAATALLTVAGATSAAAATPDPLGGVTGGLTGGLLGGSGGLPVVGGLLGGSGGSGDLLGGVLGGTGNLPLVGELTKGGIPVVGDLEGLPLIGGGELPLAPGTLPVGTVLNSVPIVGPLVGGVVGGVLDDLTGGGRAPNVGGGTTTNPHTPSGSTKAPRTSSVRADDDDRSHQSKRDRDRDENEDTDDGVIPSGGVLAGSGEATGGPSALPFLLLGAAALGSAGVGVRRLITARGGA